MALSVEQAFQGQFHITARLARAFVWVTVVVAHLLLAVVVLFLLWWFGVSPNAVHTWLVGLSASAFGRSVGVVVAVFGLSVAAIVAVYTKACHWVLSKLLSKYLFKGLGQ